MHASGHLINVNSLVLNRARIDESTEVHGVYKDQNGKPTGELISMATHYMIQKVAGIPFPEGATKYTDDFISTNTGFKKTGCVYPNHWTR